MSDKEEFVMIRLIASDLDGTLLKNGAQALSPEVFELLPALRKKGIHFVAASGRQYANIRRLFAPLQDEISYVAENGSLCMHEGKMVASGQIDRDLANEIILEARRQPDCSLLYSSPEKCYVEKGNDRLYDHIKNHVHYDVELADDLTQLDALCLKVAICNFDGADRSFGYFREKYQDLIKIVTSGNIWFDFIAPNADKGTGLAAIASALEIRPEECMTFGDQYNDIEMLAFTPNSYAMDTCAKGVERYAAHQTSSVEEVIRTLL